MSDKDDERKELQPDEDEERLRPKRTRTKGGLKGKLMFLGIGLIAGVVLGVLGLRFLQNYNPPDKPDTLSPSVVFSRIVAQNEMVSVSQDYNIVDKVTDNLNFLGFQLPINNNFWYRYTGTITAGVNMEQATYDQQGSTITVTLPAPYIISNTPDMDKSGVLEENNNAFYPIKVEKVDEFQAQCIQESEQDAIDGGLLDDAKTNAEANIQNMFTAALGDEYTIEFVWTE